MKTPSAPDPAEPRPTAHAEVLPLRPAGHPRWVLPACLAVGLLAVLVLPNGGTGLGLVAVAVAVATGAAVLPAARDRLTPWTAALGAVASGTVRLRGRERWLMAGLLGLLCALTGAALLAFGGWNPDLRVAETQVTIRGGDRLDQAYLGGLGAGAEAVPALDRLPAPARSCVLRDLVAANGLAAPDPWNGWNLARQRAREVLERRPLLGGNCPAGRSFAG